MKLITRALPALLVLGTTLISTSAIAAPLPKSKLTTQTALETAIEPDIAQVKVNKKLLKTVILGAELLEGNDHRDHHHRDDDYRRVDHRRDDYRRIHHRDNYRHDDYRRIDRRNHDYYYN